MCGFQSVPVFDEELNVEQERGEHRPPAPGVRGGEGAHFILCLEPLCNHRAPPGALWPGSALGSEDAAWTEPPAPGGGIAVNLDGAGSRASRREAAEPTQGSQGQSRRERDLLAAQPRRPRDANPAGMPHAPSQRSLGCKGTAGAKDAEGKAGRGVRWDG